VTREWPALDVINVSVGNYDSVALLLDDFHPTALEDRDTGIRAFFETSASRDAASATLTRRGFIVAPIEVSDEDWATRSQESLPPVTVDRITITSEPWPSRDSFSLVIRPSMGFGTGHHPTTRLCLAALQDVSLTGSSVLDVGTGSGILAIAASILGAAEAIGLDADADAVQSATENLLLNPWVGPVHFVRADLTTTSLPVSDVVVANLTGALLVRSADILKAAVRRPGALIVSGLLESEEEAVGQAFAPADTLRRQEDEWVCLTIRMR
jgi:ribosomal protein L11 methyltransferase